MMLMVTAIAGFAPIGYKNFTCALADLDTALHNQPGEAVFHHARGRIHQQLGNFSAALADYERVDSGATIAIESI